MNASLPWCAGHCGLLLLINPAKVTLKVPEQAAA